MKFPFFLSLAAIDAEGLYHHSQQQPWSLESYGQEVSSFPVGVIQGHLADREKAYPTANHYKAHGPSLSH